MKVAHLPKAETDMQAAIIIEPFGDQSPDEIFDFILPIQTEEFGVATDRKSQPDIEDIAGNYQKGRSNFWVALSEGKIIGTIALSDIGGTAAALRRMYVRADHRGSAKGIGQSLWEIARQWASEKGMTDIYLGTTVKYLAAHRFYEKNGFQEIARAELPVAFPVASVDTKFYRFRLKP